MNDIEIDDAMWTIAFCYMPKADTLLSLVSANDNLNWRYS